MFVKRLLDITISLIALIFFIAINVINLLISNNKPREPGLFLAREGWKR